MSETSEIGPTSFPQRTHDVIRQASATGRSHVTRTVSAKLAGLFKADLRTDEAIIGGRIVHFSLYAR